MLYPHRRASVPAAVTYPWWHVACNFQACCYVLDSRSLLVTWLSSPNHLGSCYNKDIYVTDKGTGQGKGNVLRCYG